MFRQLCLITDPNAGGGRAARFQPAALRQLRQLGFKVRGEVTNGREAAAHAAAAAAEREELVVTLGGDGLIGAAAEGIKQNGGGCLAVLPAGRGNDFARALGVPLALRSACALIREGSPRLLDLGEAGGKVFVSSAYVGFDSKANELANRTPALLGRFAYAAGALRALGTWKPVSFRVTYKEQPIEGERSRWRTLRERSFRGFSVVIANTPFYGGGMMVAPTAQPDDGLLELVTIEQMVRARFLAHLPTVYNGGHLRLREVEWDRCLEATVHADQPIVMYADGDPIAELPAAVRVLPRAVEVLAPPHGGRSRKRRLFRLPTP
jgi:YegS/Rv2252/BmrU family lipid kinase